LSKELVKQLLEAGVHFGHLTRKWNPKMKQYIFGSKNGIYVIDLIKTIEHLEKACEFLRKTAARGGKVLFVGTKSQAREIVKGAAENTEMYFVINRFAGYFRPLNIFGVGGRNLHGNVSYKLFKIIRSGNKICFAIDLN